jgi:hypothetical protein
MDELLTIVDYSRFDSAINPAFDCPPAYYWSSSTYAYKSGATWGAFFYNGYASWLHKEYGNYVRCVRGGP